MENNLLLTHISSLYGITTKDCTFKKGWEMREIEFSDNSWILINNGLIESFGKMHSMPDFGDINTYNVENKAVLPGFIDSHTHVVFADWRVEEYILRMKGHSYEEIAEWGGGILNSAKKMQDASEEDLYQNALARVNQVISLGTTALEIKSGYGLTLEAELKMLRVINKLKQTCPITIKATFLGAHAIPQEFKDNRKEYIDSILNEMIPAVAKENLADYIDVFCDKGFFTPEETIAICQKGAEFGLKARIHANELGITGGVEAGIAANALSVDHLEHLEQAQIDALKESDTIPTALPGTSYFLKIPYADTRNMIDQGLGVCLASDYNPGSSPTGNLQIIMSLACQNMNMLPEEAFNAITLNAAKSLEIHETEGSICVGKKANLLIADIPQIGFIPYHFGVNHIEKVIINGKFWN
jgi:imidazolonepropionase